MHTRLHEVAGILFLLQANKKTYTIFYSNLKAYTSDRMQRDVRLQSWLSFLFFHFALRYLYWLCTHNRQNVANSAVCYFLFIFF